MARLIATVAALPVATCATAILRVPLGSKGRVLQAPPPGQRDALAALYTSTGGADWRKKDKWLDDSPGGCDWQGVSCTDQVVTRLYLSLNQLSGTLPQSISQLTALTKLELSLNQLSGTLPQSISQLTALTRLALDQNQLSGTLPQSISQLTALTWLDLSLNQLSGTLPQSIGQLTALTLLALGGNQLSGTLPQSISQLTALTKLELSLNQLSGTLPQSISQLTALTRLALDQNQLSGTLPQSISQLTALTLLTLSSNQLSGTLPESVAQLTALTELYLSSNQLSGTLPQSIGQLTALEKLDVHNNSFAGEPPWSALARLTHLAGRPGCLDECSVFPLLLKGNDFCGRWSEADDPFNRLPALLPEWGKQPPNASEGSYPPCPTATPTPFTAPGAALVPTSAALPPPDVPPESTPEPVQVAPHPSGPSSGVVAAAVILPLLCAIAILAVGASAGCYVHQRRKRRLQALEAVSRRELVESLLAEREVEQRLRQEEEAIIAANEQALQQTLQETEQLRRQLVPANCFSGRLVISEEEVGRGAFGIIYKGLDPASGIVLAVKLVKLVSASEDEVVKEMQLLECLEHPHTVRCFGTDLQEGKAVIAMEFCAGGSLMQTIKQYGILEDTTVAALFRQVGEGLLYLHQNCIMHRDLKPHNILLTESGVAKLADFGCSSLQEVDKTSTRTVAGTVLYMAPECLAGRASFPSDMWSLGMTVLHCATGVAPWSHVKTPEGHSPLEPQLIWHITQPDNDHPIPGEDDLAQWIAAVVRHCLARDPAQRLRCEEFVHWLHQT